MPPLMGGAVEKIWFALGKEFARRGHEVVHISRLCNGLPREEVIEGVRHVRVPGYDTPGSLLLLKGCDLLYSLRALRVLPQADILLTNTFWLPMLVRSKRPGKLYVHAARYPKGQMRFYAHADRLQTVSQPIKEAIEREVPELADKVRCISNPLSGAVPSLVPVEREKQILYVGRVHPEKGIALLLEAMSLIPEPKRAGWKLVVVGPAEARYGGGGESYLEELRRRAEKIKDHVVWTGAIFDPECLDIHYRSASLFVYPSLAEKGETFGLAPLEAMAQGCPALVSNLDCFRDFIVEDCNGFVFDHRSANPAQALAAKLQELIGDPERLARAAVFAHQRAGEFSLERIAGQYLADFQSLLG
ncbi:MAG: glycosyltransferase family 4 protein [Verrucomicrobia bacterium]|nr:glycosyltransferase family 4 protein [Verrucomicrobiota bacterium]